MRMHVGMVTILRLRWPPDQLGNFGTSLGTLNPELLGVGTYSENLKILAGRKIDPKRKGGLEAGDCSGRGPARARAARMMADTSDCSDSSDPSDR
jgi:hypothetical protein